MVGKVGVATAEGEASAVVDGATVAGVAGLASVAGVAGSEGSAGEVGEAGKANVLIGEF